MQPYQRAILTLTGRPPGLIVHSSELADATNEFTVKINELVAADTGGKHMTEQQREQKELLQWRGAFGTVYWDGEHVVVPTNNLLKATVLAAREWNLGTKIEDRGAITFGESTMIIDIGDPDFTMESYKDEKYRFRTIVNGNPSKGPKGGKVVSMRPVFPVWQTTVTCLVLTEMINWDAKAGNFVQIIESAGNVGIGNGRKIGYGRFDVTIEKI